MIHVSQLHYHIGQKAVLKDISFHAAPGELLAIIGPNGAGKSTLFRLLSGDLTLQRGEIQLQQKPIQAYSSLDMARFRAVLAQSNPVSLNLRVFDIVLMGRYPHFYGKPQAEDIHIVENLLKELGIQDLAARSYDELSGGEQQRVHLARVLAQIYGNKQGILLLDEPTNGLDLQYQQLILDKARQLADAGRTVLCILHDINFASKYADHILILKKGSCVARGKPDEIISEENIFNTYHTKVRLINDPSIGYPFIVPLHVRS